MIVYRDKMPVCKVCNNAKASVTTSWKFDNRGREYNTLMQISKKQKLIVKKSGPICAKCKDELNRELRGMDSGGYFSKKDIKVHRRYEEELEIRLSTEEFNDIMKGTRSLHEIKSMIDLNIDWRVYRSVQEYSIHNKVKSSYSLESIRDIRGDINLSKSSFEYENYKVLAFLQNGTDVLIDYISKEPFKTHNVNIGTEKFKIIYGFEIEDRPDHHHFVLDNGKSLLKGKSEPANLIMNCSITSNKDIFLECMGLWSVSNTFHKSTHSNFKNFDIMDAIRLGVEPFWAKSNKNFKEVQKKYPGMIDNYSYWSMLEHFSLK